MLDALLDVLRSGPVVSFLASLLMAGCVYVLGGLLGWVGLGGGVRVETRVTGVTYILRSGWKARGEMLLVGLMFAVGAALFVYQGQVTKDEDVQIGCTACGVLLALILPLMTVGMIHQGIIITDEELTEYGSLRFRPIKIMWGEVSNVMYWGGREEFSVDSASKRIRVAMSLEGFEYFVLACHQHLAPVVYEKAFKECGIPVKESPP